MIDMAPHPFQERILDALEAERSVHNRWRNLIVAATGTGKTVVAAFDFKRFYQSSRIVKPASCSSRIGAKFLNRP